MPLVHVIGQTSQIQHQNGIPECGYLRGTRGRIIEEEIIEFWLCWD